VPFRTQRGQLADVVVTVVVLTVHGLLFGVTIAILSFFVMGTDPCAYQECGDQAWVDRALALGYWGGGALLVVDLVVAVVRLAREKVAWFVPLIGCAAQLALAVGAAGIESLAFPT
jgi:hypothetical protein